MVCLSSEMDYRGTDKNIVHRMSVEKWFYNVLAWLLKIYPLDCNLEVFWEKKKKCYILYNNFHLFEIQKKSNIACATVLFFSTLLKESTRICQISKDVQEKKCKSY